MHIYTYDTYYGCLNTLYISLVDTYYTNKDVLKNISDIQSIDVTQCLQARNISRTFSLERCTVAQLYR